MTIETPTPGEKKSELDRALEALLVGEVRIKIDPATGLVVGADGEKPPLTDPPEPNTIR